MIRARSFFWSALAAALFAATSPSALACTVCFGDPNSNLTKGQSFGIAALLLIITCVLCGVAGFFVYLAKRSAQLEHNTFPTNFSENRTNA
ncbi:MAG TPA: hypothetical protein VF773_09175 [Verrucomicrobiae bacterium]